MPPTDRYRPEPRFPELGPGFFDPVEPASFPQLVLRFRNQRWAERVGLDGLDDDEWQRAFGRFEPLPDNLPEPLALRYHGHQFRVYNPALGDGRGFLYAQLRDDRGRLLDLATKGSGQTPWSRGGDGRLTLKGGVRELLATEMLEALGVYTSKTFSLIETGETLYRNDEPSPTRSCVLVRLGHSHVRIGSFQRHAYHEDRDRLRALLDHCLAHYAPELCCPDAHAAALFLRLVVERSAELCASWMVAGFVHGVLNSDNMNITGESFDYGPYRFLPTHDPTFTAAYFDHGGLYAYGRQPHSVRWNLERLAESLQPLANTALRDVVADFEPAYAGALVRAVLRRLGLRPRSPWRDRLLAATVFDVLARSQIGFEQLFFDCFGGPARARIPDPSLAHAMRGYDPADHVNLDHPYLQRPAPRTMLIDQLETIWSAIADHDDWSPLHQAITDIRLMGDGLAFLNQARSSPD